MVGRRKRPAVPFASVLELIAVSERMWSSLRPRLLIQLQIPQHWIRVKTRASRWLADVPTWASEAAALSFQAVAGC